ncbi:hypothetical protein Zmor_011982 [Zophobas morio]|uniref:Uncharacterized protein n=1 Tax=Zophobas morio TaxID=2755281 RepID=A0AA38LYP2_9CUCU|nr:hypothetical protein Zmor_011982 [Zophobas morio]
MGLEKGSFFLLFASHRPLLQLQGRCSHYTQHFSGSSLALFTYKTGRDQPTGESRAAEARDSSAPRLQYYQIPWFLCRTRCPTYAYVSVASFFKAV